jgi:hypothetical protein
MTVCTAKLAPSVSLHSVIIIEHVHDLSASKISNANSSVEIMELACS